MGTIETLLADHAARMDAVGATWFTATDLDRLGLRGSVMSVMQEAQHALRMRGDAVVVEALGQLERFSLRTTR